MENIQKLVTVVEIYNLEFFGYKQQNTKQLETTLTPQAEEQEDVSADGIDERVLNWA